MSSRPVIVVDASVLLAAKDIDDRNHHDATLLLRSPTSLATLDLALYEVTDVAVMVWRNGDAGSVSGAGSGRSPRTGGSCVTCPQEPVAELRETSPVTYIGQLDEAAFAATRWFHSIDFGAFASSGRFQRGDPQNVTLFGTMDLIDGIDMSGADVLDIGTVDGLIAFGARALGAARVVATDSVRRPSFELAREALRLDLEYVPGAQISELVATFGRGAFDVVICAGVIYHMFNPVSAFFECRKLVKEHGLVIVESACTRRSDEAVIYVNSEDESFAEPQTYSMPTSRAVVGLMRLALFDVLAIRHLRNPDRITVLGRAVGPNEVGGRTALTQRIHEVDFCDFGYQIRRDWPSPTASTIAYAGARDERAIDQGQYRPTFPFHPPPDRRTVGTTAWSTPTGNR